MSLKLHCMTQLVWLRRDVDRFDVGLLPLAGLLDVEEMLRALGQEQDVLGALAALQLLQELAQRCDAGAAALLAGAAMPQLLALSCGGDPMLRSQALQARGPHLP